ncbi:MAG: hypothetical protein C4522_16540 [Desulfobacteraceae bacterium]|nr:MAG: hypothetical protein C4522_16540 [Desulfobacteraceae bacterium]
MKKTFCFSAFFHFDKITFICARTKTFHPDRTMVGSSFMKITENSCDSEKGIIVFLQRTLY